MMEMGSVTQLSRMESCQIPSSMKSNMMCSLLVSSLSLYTTSCSLNIGNHELYLTDIAYEVTHHFCYRFPSFLVSSHLFSSDVSERCHIY